VVFVSARALWFAMEGSRIGRTDAGRNLCMVGVLQEAMTEGLACLRIFLSIPPSDGGEKRCCRWTAFWWRDIRWRIVGGSSSDGFGIGFVAVVRIDFVAGGIDCFVFGRIFSQRNFGRGKVRVYDVFDGEHFYISDGEIFDIYSVGVGIEFVGRRLFNDGGKDTGIDGVGRRKLVDIFVFDGILFEVRSVRVNCERTFGRKIDVGI